MPVRKVTAEGEGQHRQVDAGLARVEQVRGAERHEGLDAPAGEQQAERPPRRRAGGSRSATGG